MTIKPPKGARINPSRTFNVTRNAQGNRVIHAKDGTPITVIEGSAQLSDFIGQLAYPDDPALAAAVAATSADKLDEVLYPTDEWKANFYKGTRDKRAKTFR